MGILSRCRWFGTELYIVVFYITPFHQFYLTSLSLSKGNSVQEACAKCFAVHILEFEIFQITWKKWNKEHQTFSFQFFINRSSIWCFLFCFFMWFTRFQILISEPQCIWRKLLVLSWLYLIFYPFLRNFTAHIAILVGHFLLLYIYLNGRVQITFLWLVTFRCPGPSQRGPKLTV